MKFFSSIRFLFLFFLFFSCEEKPKIPTCEEAEEMARTDFNQGKFVHYEYQNLTDDKSANDEFSKIMKKKNIQVVFNASYPISDVIVEEEEIEKSKVCYQILMRHEMQAKFGLPFFDSVRIEAKKMHEENFKP